MKLQKINLLREKYKIQLKSDQLNSIIKTIKNGCNLLIFGVGNDTPFWLEANKNGKTIFVEDNKVWAKKIKLRNKKTKYILVNYKTRLSNWSKLLEKPHELSLKLNDEIRKTKWDVILVDAPRGYKNFHPGRMKSIYQASILIKKKGHVFVHDCDRLVEKVYTDKYLLNKNLVEEISNLRHYVIK